MSQERRLGYGLLVPALLLLGAFLAYPIASAFVSSLHAYSLTGEREFVGLQQYRELLQDRVALGSLGFTFLFVGVSVSLGLLLALLIHPPYRGRGLVRGAVLIPWAIPTVAAAVMWKYMFNDQYGFVNLVLFGSDLPGYQAWLSEPATARLAIIFADVWKTSSFAALLILAGLQTIPRDLHEAARVDGAGSVRRFLTITLPLLRPALLVALLFRMMDAFRVFDLVFVMTQGGPADSTNVLQFYGYQKMFPEQQFGYGSAVSVVVFLIIAAVAAVTIRLVGTRIVET